ncbi:MAG TPA: hypothetical protein VGM74_22605 [Burkholderiaceae bacterium]|jgi:hypothetical protein
MTSARPCLAAALALVALWIAAPAAAQQLYRCGNTYSQTPCAADAAPLRSRSDAAPDAAPGLSGGELCSAAVVQELQLDDSGTVQIDSVTKAPAEVIQYADKPTATHKFIVTLKIKPYAPYSGPRAFSCNLSEDEHRVLRFAARRP